MTQDTGMMKRDKNMRWKRQIMLLFRRFMILN